MQHAKMALGVALGLTLPGACAPEDTLEPQNAADVSTFNVEVDFGEVASFARSGCTGSETTDSPQIDAGLDCDEDGGVVAFQTPQSYRIAFKRVFLSTSAGDEDILNAGSLSAVAEQHVLAFDPAAPSQDLSVPEDIASDDVNGIGFEIYYYELTLTMYGESETIRIYMSDDDFASEGNLGHHQGDITYFDDDGVEHWANGGSNWFSEPTATQNRGDFANGDGGTDAQTGHPRGMFGDATFWNNSDFDQGADQDVYWAESGLGTSRGDQLTLTFDIENTWFYENFSDVFSDSFDPCEGATLEGCGGEWAPLNPSVTATALSPASE